MSKITDIEVQKKNTDRVNLYVDGEYLMSLYAEIVYKYRLTKGQEIEKDKIKEILKREEYEKAKNKALQSLTRAEKSESKMREKLLKDFEEDTVEEVIEFLKKYSLIDDERYADRIVTNDVNYKKIGKNRIKQNLYSKGIDREHIESAISGIDREKELENAIVLAEKKLPKIKSTDKRTIKNKLYQHLAYKGFDYDIINSAIRTVLDSNEY